MPPKTGAIASRHANITKLKDCKLPGERHILQVLVVGAPEAQGLQAVLKSGRGGGKRWGRVSEIDGHVPVTWWGKGCGVGVVASVPVVSVPEAQGLQATRQM